MGHIVSIIPARSGSKTIKDKNIRVMNGKPMLAYSIEQALASKKIDRVIVSTDSQVYRDIAIRYGAEAPFLRPTEVSGDRSQDIEVFEHALHWLMDNEDYAPDLCVHLRPTHPIRDPTDIDEMVSRLENSPEFDSIRSVSPAKQTPYKMWLFKEDNSTEIVPLASCDIPEAYNAPRQILPRVYIQNACIDVVRSRTILEDHSMTGTHIAGYKMAYDFDVDTEEDFEFAEKIQLLLKACEEKCPLKICCDIDGVIAAKTINNDYNQAAPLEKNIAILRELYKRGHQIVLFTARGYATGIDWRDVTTRQMDQWNVPHHQLLFGKPDADIYIDDKFFELPMLERLLQG